MTAGRAGRPAGRPSGTAHRAVPPAEELLGALAGTTRFGPGTPLAPALTERLASACARLDLSPEGRAAAGTDWWPLSAWWAAAGRRPALPAAVAHPTSTAEVADVMAICSRAAIPVTPAGGRSGVCGAAVPVHGGIALDLTGMAGIGDVHDADLLVDVAPGTYGDVLEDDLRTGSGLTIGHWPQSMAISTVGGWVACRGAGQYSTRYGKIEDLVAGLEVVLADGTVLRTGGRAPRSATGPDLTALFVGSEGVLGVITGVRLRAHPVPPAEERAAWSFASFAAGMEACRRILRRGATPAVLRLYDPAESARHFGTPAGAAVLVVLDEADPGLVAATMAVVAEECAAARAGDLDVGVVGTWLERRNDVASLAGLAQAGIVADTIEVAAAWSVLPALHAEVLAALRALPGTLAVSAHQSHAYRDGACLYFTFAGRPGDVGPDAAGDDDGPGSGTGTSSRLTAGEDYYRAAWDAVMDATVAQGGTISHHHGVGLNRGRHLPRELGPAWRVLAGLKAALDPAGVLNPGKLGLDSPWGPPPRP